MYKIYMYLQNIQGNLKLLFMESKYLKKNTSLRIVHELAIQEYLQLDYSKSMNLHHAYHKCCKDQAKQGQIYHVYLCPQSSHSTSIPCLQFKTSFQLPFCHIDASSMTISLHFELRNFFLFLLIVGYHPSLVAFHPQYHPHAIKKTYTFPSNYFVEAWLVYHKLNQMEHTLWLFSQ